MSVLDDAYKAAAKAVYEHVEKDAPSWAACLPHANVAINAFLSHLADNPPEEMVEAMVDRRRPMAGPVSPLYEQRLRQEAIDSFRTALRSIGADK